MKGSTEKKRVIAVVPAAGLGKRFGAGKKKTLRLLCGKPVVIWPLQVLESDPGIAEIIPVLRVEDMEQGRKMFEEFNISKIRKIAAGGRERQDSVFSGLKQIDDNDCIVLIHDGVRPLIEKKLVDDAIRELQVCSVSGGESGRNGGIDGVVLGVPVKDTIKTAENGTVHKTLSRDSLWAVQTPQVFLYRKLLAAYERAEKEGFYATDDSALLEHCGGKVRIVAGSYRNIKVTTPEDLGMAEFLLRKTMTG